MNTFWNTTGKEIFYWMMIIVKLRIPGIKSNTMKKYILLAIVGLLLMSCFEDKGNYSYTVGEQITVSGVEKE